MRETDCRSADGRMARILFIDDDVQTLDLFGQILEGAGHEVIMARDGVTGIALYRKNPTDLIITDIMMPVKDGMEVINELKQDFPQAKIIAISGSDREVRREFFFDVSRILGAKRTFHKPIDPVELLQAIRELAPD
jgi:CheY-like chemotaxis protein